MRCRQRGKKRLRCLRPDTAGFTLVEALVTVVLFLFIYGAVTFILIAGTETWQIRSTKVELQQELRKAMEKIKNDLCQAGSSVISGVPPGDEDDPWYPSITFKMSSGVASGNIVWGSDMQYVLAGANADEIHRTQGLQDQVVALSIASMQFQRLSSAPDLITVALQAQKNTGRGRSITDSLTFEVQLRN